MPIVQARNDNTGLFDIVLPQEATAEQNKLKEKIEALLKAIEQQRDDSSYATWVANLQAIAKEGFDAPAPDVAAADRKADALYAVTRPKSKSPTPSQAQIGAYEIDVPNPEKDPEISWREIIFEVPGEIFPIPPAQLKLKADVETVLTTLQLVFPDKDGELHPKVLTIEQRRYKSYQTKLVGIAQTGLQTPADPESARQYLESLQIEILLQEGPRIKNGYMKRLGIAAAAFATVSAILYLVVRNNRAFSELIFAYRNLFVLWTGTMIGTWLSFGVRRPTITFKDLGGLEDDMIEPAVRLVFTGLLAVAIAFIFAVGMVNVNVGGLNSVHLFAHGSSALLIGMLMGVSEQALPGALTRRASQFVSEISGK